MQQSKKIYIIILFIFFVIFTETNKINFIIQIVLNFFVAFVMIDCSRCWLEVVTDNCATTVLFLSFVPTSDYVPSEWFFSRHLKTSSVPSVPVPVPSPLISRFRFRFRVVEIEKLRFRFGYRYRFFWNRRALLSDGIIDWFFQCHFLFWNFYLFINETFSNNWPDM